MRYTVIWKWVALNQLAAIWLDAVNRQAVTAAADALEAQLRINAHSLGESRAGNTRVVIEGPLAILFDVHEMDCRVDVLSVRYVLQRPSNN